jgi:putative transposase
MKYAQKPSIVLTDRERAVLQRVATSRTHARQYSQRATIILRLAAGVTKQAIAPEVRLTRKVVYCWYNRWLAAQDKLTAATEVADKEFRPLIAEILADQPRPGAPLTFTAEQVGQIMALACQKPEALGLPFTTWTPSDLARVAVQRDIVPSISPASEGRFLKSGGFTAPEISVLVERQ